MDSFLSHCMHLPLPTLLKITNGCPLKWQLSVVISSILKDYLLLQQSVHNMNKHSKGTDKCGREKTGGPLSASSGK